MLIDIFDLTLAQLYLYAIALCNRDMLTVFLIFAVGKLMEMHGDAQIKSGTDETGQKIDRPEGYEPPIQQTV